jgi:chemotaxis protein MotB
MYFDSGSAALRPELIGVLQVIGSAISVLDNVMIEVEGHTDWVPINTVRFPDNRELSVARAAAVTRFLEGNFNIDSANIASTGFGEHRPVADNNTVEGRQLNRRVEIILTEIQN